MRVSSYFVVFIDIQRAMKYHIVISLVLRFSFLRNQAKSYKEIENEKYNQIGFAVRAQILRFQG